MSLLRLGRFADCDGLCHYGQSRLSFRGPARDLSGEYIACLGGSETFGQTVERPFPAMLEEATGQVCVNLGLPNAGIDVLLKDPGLLAIASRAVMTVLQVPGALNLTTRFYNVHPRRNDRVTAIHSPLTRLYPEVDFTQFAFTRHLIAHLQAVSPERFLHIQAELAAVWTKGMRQVLSAISGPVVLLWFSDRAPNENGNEPGALFDPSLVSSDMLEAVSGRATALIACPRGVDVASRSSGREFADLFRSRREAELRKALPNEETHHYVAQTLLPEVIRRTRK